MSTATTGRETGVHLMFLPVLLACVGEARAPEPRELAELVDQIRREAFPHRGSTQSWESAWCVACVALSGTVAPYHSGLATKLETILSYMVSWTTGDETMLDAEVHASASSALARLCDLSSSGKVVTIMGPNGEKLSEQALSELALAETMESDPPPLDHA